MADELWPVRHCWKKNRFVIFSLFSPNNDWILEYSFPVDRQHHNYSTKLKVKKKTLRISFVIVTTDRATRSGGRQKYALFPIRFIYYCHRPNCPSGGARRFIPPSIVSHVSSTCLWLCNRNKLIPIPSPSTC